MNNGGHSWTVTTAKAHTRASAANALGAGRAARIPHTAAAGTYPTAARTYPTAARTYPTAARTYPTAARNWSTAHGEK